MPARSKLLIALFLLASVAATASIYQLFSLRFEAGDVFPAGSSLRSDPLGSMALYQALEQTGDIRVRRNYRPFAHQQLTGSTILLLGSGQQLLVNRQGATELDALTAAGNRVVIAFTPTSTAPKAAASAPPKTDGTPQKPETAWDITTGQLPVTQEHPEHSMVKARLVDRALPLPAEALFISRLYLQPPATGWRVIYAADDKPLVLERTIGSGSLVLVSDSSIFSNEALREGRQSHLLTWLTGANRTIIFDESHLGVTEQGGIMALARRFGLLPLLGALLLLAGLYIWQQSIPLTPSAPSPATDNAIGVTHDSFSGLVNLLRRSIPDNQLLKTCCTEWKKSFSHELKQDEALRAELDDAMTKADDPLTRYQRIARLRAERTGR